MHTFLVKMKSRFNYRKLRAQASTHPLTQALLGAPDLGYLLINLLKDPRVPTAQRLKLGAAMAYFLSPLELIPIALLGPAGLGGDIALAAHTLNSLLNDIDPQILKDHWAGDGDVLEAIQKIAAVSNRILGAGVWRKIIRRARRAA
jgi:uncharacterized membrane protein YkvA (DUF1232 family)